MTIDEAFNNPSLEFIKEILERFLETVGITKQVQDSMIYYGISGLAVDVAEYNANSLSWYQPATKNQIRAIKAHCALC
jgi:hypothetical protein